MKELFKQLVKFGIVGVLAFIIDYGILYILVEYFNVYYLLASSVSFTFSVVFNYLSSMKFVFERRKDLNRSKEFLVFVLLSIIGLIINQLIMWFLVEKINVFYMISKIVATGFVMVWNFTSRKIFLEKK